MKKFKIKTNFEGVEEVKESVFLQSALFYIRYDNTINNEDKMLLIEDLIDKVYTQPTGEIFIWKLHDLDNNIVLFRIENYK